MNENFPTPKVIGGSAYEKEEVDKLVQRKQRESLESLYGEDLLESTPEENEVISSAVDYVQAVAEQYGSQRNASVDRVAVVKNGALKKTEAVHIRALTTRSLWNVANRCCYWEELWLTSYFIKWDISHFKLKNQRVPAERMIYIALEYR